MSCLCSVQDFEGVDELSLEIKQDLIDMLEKAYIRLGYELEANTLFEEFSSCEDDPTGVIYDWCIKHTLDISYTFVAEEGDMLEVVFKDGEEINIED